MQRITKVKVKDGVIYIYSAENLGAAARESVYHSVEQAAPAFYSAFVALEKVVRSILGLPGAWPAAGGMVVSALHLSEASDGSEGCVISGTVPMLRTDAPFCFNTPYVRLEGKKGDACLSAEEKGAVDYLIKAAEEYAAGKRAQTEIPGTEKK